MSQLNQISSRKHLLNNPISSDIQKASPLPTISGISKEPPRIVTRDPHDPLSFGTSHIAFTTHLSDLKDDELRQLGRYRPGKHDGTPNSIRQDLRSLTEAASEAIRLTRGPPALKETDRFELVDQGFLDSHKIPSNQKAEYQLLSKKIGVSVIVSKAPDSNGHFSKVTFSHGTRHFFKEKGAVNDWGQNISWVKDKVGEQAKLLEKFHLLAQEIMPRSRYTDIEVIGHSKGGSLAKIYAGAFVDLPSTSLDGLPMNPAQKKQAENLAKEHGLDPGYFDQDRETVFTFNAINDRKTNLVEKYNDRDRTGACRIQLPVAGKMPTRYGHHGEESEPGGMDELSDALSEFAVPTR